MKTLTFGCTSCPNSAKRRLRIREFSQKCSTLTVRSPTGSLNGSVTLGKVAVGYWRSCAMSKTLSCQRRIGNGAHLQPTAGRCATTDRRSARMSSAHYIRASPCRGIVLPLIVRGSTSRRPKQAHIRAPRPPQIEIPKSGLPELRRYPTAGNCWEHSLVYYGH